MRRPIPHRRRHQIVARVVYTHQAKDVRIFATDVRTGERQEVTDWMYFFEEEMISELHDGHPRWKIEFEVESDE